MKLQYMPICAAQRNTSTFHHTYITYVDSLKDIKIVRIGVLYLLGSICTTFWTLTAQKGTSQDRQKTVLASLLYCTFGNSFKFLTKREKYVLKFFTYPPIPVLVWWNKWKLAFQFYLQFTLHRSSKTDDYFFSNCKKNSFSQETL
jgi:hypothetical protein